MGADPRVRSANGRPTGHTPSWWAGVVVLALACLPGSISHVSLDRAPRARIGTVRMTAGTQRVERCGAEIFRSGPPSGVSSAPEPAPRETRHDAGHAAVLSLTASVESFGAVPAVDVPVSFPVSDRPLLTHAGRSPPRS
jgi:hypothetical protein